MILTCLLIQFHDLKTIGEMPHWLNILMLDIKFPEFLYFSMLTDNFSPVLYTFNEKNPSLAVH